MTRRLIPAACLAVLAAIALAAEPPQDTLPKELPFTPVPVGLDPLPVPKDNLLTPERIALGRRLFFDPILSGDKTVSCASCHHPERGFAEGKPLGIRGQALARRAPSLLNRAYGKTFFYDGRSATLEEQALEPIANPQEMGSSVEESLQRLKADATYRDQFSTAYSEGVTAPNLGKALASFQRVLLSGNSRVDRFLRGEHDILNADERHGMWIFDSKGRCWACHGGSNFSDEDFHNTGVSFGQTLPDLGRETFTKKLGDRGKFKTPSLRGVGKAAPYMHDGSLKSLEEVAEYYSRGGRPDSNLDSRVRPLNLSKEEQAALVAFLKAL